MLVAATAATAVIGGNPHLSALACLEHTADPGSGDLFEASSVPLVDDKGRRRSLASYPNRPDAKALAITGPGHGCLRRAAECRSREAGCFATMLRQNPQAMPNLCRGHGRCLVEGSAAAGTAGRFFVFDTLKIPPGSPKTYPLSSAFGWTRLHGCTCPRQIIGAGPHHRRDWTVSGKATRAEAIRLAIERCTEFWQLPCLLLSVDGMADDSDSQIAAGQRHLLPSSEPDILAEDRARIAQVYRGPTGGPSVKGKERKLAPVAAVSSEAAAIESALKSCSEADTAVSSMQIGNFRIAEE